MIPKQLSTNWTLEQTMMTLSAIAYADPSDIPQQLANPNYATENAFDLVWGPVYEPGKEQTGHLMYVVQINGLDNMFVTVIRGFVFNFDIRTLLNLYGRLDVGTMEAWVFPQVTGANIAKGIMSELKSLTSMKDPSGMTLMDFFSKRTDNVVFVTGHSLGGCFASAMAPWLMYELQKLNVEQLALPLTFAAPAAGNQVFKDWFNQLYTIPLYAYRDYNTIDAIPMAWNDLIRIKTLFPDGPECPIAVQSIIDQVQDLLDQSGASYAQTIGLAYDGTVSNSGDWLTEMAYQHHYNTYLTLLGAPNVTINGAS